MKVKLFYCDNKDGLEVRIQEFLDEVGNINIVKSLMAESMGGEGDYHLTLILVYEELAEGVKNTVIDILNNAVILAVGKSTEAMDEFDKFVDKFDIYNDKVDLLLDKMDQIINKL